MTLFFFFNPFLPSGSEPVRSVLIVLPEMLLLVSGEVHQVPQQERVHHGERPHHSEAPRAADAGLNFGLFLFQIAIYGKNFCVSAKNAFMLLMRNVIRSVPKLLLIQRSWWL